MKLKGVIIIDWYDGIIKAFGSYPDGELLYFSLLGGDDLIHPHKKVYLCTNIKHLKGHKRLLEIIANDTFKENWNELGGLITLNDSCRECYLAKTTDLSDSVELIKYKTDFRWPDDIVWGDFPDSLEEAEKIDDWQKYYE